MKKEYVTARLFRNIRAADGLIPNEELDDSAQQQSEEVLNNIPENNTPKKIETVKSTENPNIPSLPQRLLTFLQKVLN